MEAYNKIRINRNWTSFEIMILLTIVSMYSGLLLALLGMIIK